MRRVSSGCRGGTDMERCLSEHTLRKCKVRLIKFAHVPGSAGDGWGGTPFIDTTPSCFTRQSVKGYDVMCV